jgi:hypothetical protein
MDKSEGERVLIKYLLGQVSSQERDALEDQYFADDERLEELVSAENDLIDSYIRGHLSPSDKDAFERHFLTPEKQERVNFARALLHYPKGDTATPGRMAVRPGMPAARLLAVAASIAGLAMIVWLAVSGTQIRRQLAQERQEENRLRKEVSDLKTKLQESVANNRGTREPAPLEAPGTTTISMVLAPVIRGQNQQNTAFLYPGIKSLALQLNRPVETYSSYQAVLETMGGSQLLVKGDLKAVPAANGRKVIVEFLPRNLSSNDYILRLFGMGAAGTEELGAYSFRIVKR